jgi:hypothetical protein
MGLFQGRKALETRTLEIDGLAKKRLLEVLWLTAFVLAWSFDFLFWEKEPGINFPLFVLLCLIGGFTALAGNGVRPEKVTLLLLPLLFFFAFATAWRQEPLTRLLAFAGSLDLLALFAAHFTTSRWLSYGFLDHALSRLSWIPSLLLSPLLLWGEWRRAQAASGSQGVGSAWPHVLRGLFLAAPVLFVFAALFASADPIFARWFSGLGSLEDLGELLFRGASIALVSYFLVGVFAHAAWESGKWRLPGDRFQLIPKGIGFVEAAFVLASVVVLFSVFVLIQVQYLFGGEGRVRDLGLSYSEYARRGFFELAAVACLSILLYLGFSAFTQVDTAGKKRALLGLYLAMFALVGVILLSALKRLDLYEEAYGFTRLRTYTHVALLSLLVLLLLLALLELRQRPERALLALFGVGWGFLVGLVVLNVDGFIARRNVEHALKGKPLDVGYLAELSSDATPTLVELFQAPQLSSPLREAIGAALACIQHKAKGRSELDWRSFHLSRYRQQEALRKVGGTLAGYQATFKGPRPVRVQSPEGREFSCFSSSS